MYFKAECVMAVHGHPLSLIPIGHQLLLMVLGPIVPSFRYIAGFLLKTVTTPLFYPNFGVFGLY